MLDRILDWTGRLLLVLWYVFLLAFGALSLLYEVWSAQHGLP